MKEKNIKIFLTCIIIILFITTLYKQYQINVYKDSIKNVELALTLHPSFKVDNTEKLFEQVEKDPSEENRFDLVQYMNSEIATANNLITLHTFDINYDMKTLYNTEQYSVADQNFILNLKPIGNNRLSEKDLNTFNMIKGGWIDLEGSLSAGVDAHGIKDINEYIQSYVNSIKKLKDIFK